MAKRGSGFNHALDRYAGIPLVYLLGKLKWQVNPVPSALTRIAILRTAAIGDTVLLTALSEALVAAYPLIHITLFVGDSNKGIAKLLPPSIHRVIPIRTTNLFRSIEVLRNSGRFDVVIDTGQWPRLDALYSRLMSAQYRIGFATPEQYRHFTYDYAVPHRADVHEIDNFKSLLLPLLNEPTNKMPTIHVPHDVSVSSFTNKLGRYVVCHPWPGGAQAWLKEWPILNWVRLAKRLVADGYSVIFTGGREDCQKSSELVAIIGQGAYDYAGKLSLTETAALLQSASLLVSVNTGIMHIGAALDVPLVALHGPTSPLRWGPLSQKAIVITPTGIGCGYLNLGFEYNKQPTDCMERVLYEEVHQASLKLLEESVKMKNKLS
jgi:heptosyltransferase III